MQQYGNVTNIYNSLVPQTIIRHVFPVPRVVTMHRPSFAGIECGLRPTVHAVKNPAGRANRLFVAI
jgi:hypothetical protein